MSWTSFHKNYLLLKKIILTSALVPIAVYLLWMLCRVFIFDTFVIPSNSMSPTLIPGDYVLVDKLIMGGRVYKNFHFDKRGCELKSYRFKGVRSIRRNDIIVFNMPNNGGIKFIINYLYCKPCIGIPGDSISIRNGYYYNNNCRDILGNIGEQEKLSKMQDFTIPSCAVNTMPYNDYFPWTIKNFGPLYLPRRGDLVKVTPQLAILYKDILEWETKKSVTIDLKRNAVFVGGKVFHQHRFIHNYYFMAGDFAVNSCDSRYWGLVPEEYIVGIVAKVVFSKDRLTNQIRWSRIGLNV